MEAKEIRNLIANRLEYYKNKAQEALERRDYKECDKWLNKLDKLVNLIQEAFIDMKGLK